MPLTKLQRTEHCFYLNTLYNKLTAHAGITYTTCTGQDFTALQVLLDLINVAVNQNISHTSCCYRATPTFAKYLVFEIPNTRETISI